MYYINLIHAAPAALLASDLNVLNYKIDIYMNECVNQFIDTHDILYSMYIICICRIVERLGFI